MRSLCHLAVTISLTPFHYAALGFEQSANLVSAISLADYRAGTTTHKDLVMTNFNKAMALAGSNIDGTLNSVVM